MIKEPLVKQRSQTPPLTVAVNVTSQTATWDRGPKRVTGRHQPLRGFSVSELSCLSAMSERFKHIPIGQR